MSNETSELLIAQPCYVVTPSTGVVHSIPCLRAPDSAIAWPEFYDEDDRACKRCLPDGLPPNMKPIKSNPLVAYLAQHLQDKAGRA